MTSQIERTSRWIYGGIWATLVRWFRVPDQPPSLPVRPGEQLHAFRPAPGFLSYLKFFFWFGLIVIDLAILIGWIAVTVAQPWLGIVLAAPALAVAVLPDIVVYLAIHLRFDTTWYVLTDRSLRIRRGIWVIRETTITFENVQNIHVSQGPIQRLFGISNVQVQTAGGGGGSTEQGHGSPAATHQGLIEGVADAQHIRDLILARLRRSRAAGLGDESESSRHEACWPQAYRIRLREIRDAARLLQQA